MDKLTSALTQQELLWGSDLEGAVAGLFFIFALLVRMSFDNILKIDEYEYKNELQKSFFRFKRKIPFIFSESGSKTVFSKKTFILQAIGYAVGLVLLAMFVVSLHMSVDIALILLAVAGGIAVSYSLVIARMRDVFVYKAQEQKKTKKPLMELNEKEKAFLVSFKQKSHPSIHEDGPKDALFLETLDSDVIPLLLLGGELKNCTRTDITEGYRCFLETASPEMFDEYAKAYFEDVQAVMALFEKYYGNDSL